MASWVRGLSRVTLVAITLSGCEATSTVVDMGTKTDDDSTQTCLVDRPLRASVASDVDCRNVEAYSCSLVEYGPDLESREDETEECAVVDGAGTQCLRIARVLNSTAGHETLFRSREYNCYHLGVHEGPGLRLLGQAATLETALHEAASTCAEAKGESP